MSASNTAKASALGLEKVKAAAKKKGWRKTSPAFLDSACVSAATLKRFWRGIAISEDSFQAICTAAGLSCDEVLESEASLTQTSERQFSLGESEQKGSTYDDNWVGRKALTQKLQAQLTDTTRLLSLTGLTGMGKTALARYLASTLATEGYTCLHLNFDQSKPPTLASIAHTLSKQNTGTTQLKLSLPGLVARLQRHKYVLIVDAVEDLLENNSKTGWSEFKSGIWSAFFQAVLGADTWNSRLILTSQDIPNELDSLAESWPHRWCAQPLTGLTADEQMSLFQQLGLSPAPQSKEYQILSSIGLVYEGHPLSLRAIAHDITTTFDGNITAYWNEYHPQLSGQSFSQSSGLSLHNHSRYLRKRVQPRLFDMLNRLNRQMPHAYELLRAGLTPDNTPKLSHTWIQIARRLHTETVQPRLLIDVLCDRAFLTPTIINNRLHFAVHPLIQSILLPVQ